MTQIQQYLSDLSKEEKEKFVPIFETVDRFYSTVYLVVRNEHITDLEKPDQYEKRLQVILEIKKRIIHLLDLYGMNGEDIVADISSDYFEDYVNYKEVEPGLTNEEFINIIQQVSQIR